MTGTAAMIYIGFAVIFNLFSVCMTLDFMMRIFGKYDGSRVLLGLLVLTYTGVLVVASCFLYPFIKMAVMPLCSVILGIILYKNHTKIGLFYIFAFASFIGLVECLLGIVTPQLLSLVITFIAYNPWQNGLVILLNQVIIFTAYRFFTQHFNRDKLSLNGSVRIFSFVILPIFSVINLFLMLFISSYLLTPLLTLLLICDILLIPFLNLYLFYLFNKVVQNNAMRRQIALYDQASDLQYRYYQEVEQKIEASRKLVHDIKNHLQGMERLYQMGEADKGKTYGDDLRELLKGFTQDIYTDNPMLNIILNDKVQWGKSHAIEVICELKVIELSFMKEIDITTIFANLLDNALEAAQAAEDGWVRLKADQVNGFMVVTVENKTCESAVSKKGHCGYGLENVKRALEKYNGHLRIERSEALFKVSLFIPIVMVEGESNPSE